MATTTQKKRGSFSSSIGFILAAAGSAIGLGNLWKFPYVAGSCGGGIFFIFYIFFVAVLGVPIILTEMAIGRKTQLSTVAAYKSLSPKWAFIGLLGVISSFVVLSYYSVVGGWVLKYAFTYLTGGDFGANTPGYFQNFVQSPVEPVIWHIIFMLICAVIILGGVEKGIEKASKIMLPGLFVLIAFIAVRSVTLDGAAKGLKFLFVPNFEAVDSFSHLTNTLTSAMGQVFFSLGLGMGSMITYGSYLQKDSDMQKDAVLITVLDTLMAVLSGITILPAVFAFGFRPEAGTGLLFETLPQIFASLPFGRLFGFVFFVLAFFAAATSGIALLEVIAAFLIDDFGWKRKKATFIMAGIAALIGVFVSLSMGSLSNLRIGELNLFDSMAFLTDKILMPIAALFTCIFVGYFLGVDEIFSEVECAAHKFAWKKTFSALIKYVAPVLIAVIFVMGVIPR